MDDYLLPALKERPVAEITPLEVLQIIKGIEARGHVDLGRRTLSIASQIFRYAVAHGLAPSDPSRDLRGALAPLIHKPRAALTTKPAIQQLMRAISVYHGSEIVRAALWLSALTFVRPGELRGARWDEFFFDDAMWIIPSDRMKMKRDHMVPLASQVVEMLQEIKPLTGESPWVFPGRKGKQPISENTVSMALQSMGFSQEQMSAHGFRAMASTMLNEQGWPPDVIERQLAHVEGNKVRAAYNRAAYLPERKKMMQEWADFLMGLALI